MIQADTAPATQELSPSLIKQILVTALSRPKGLWLPVVMVAGRSVDMAGPVRVLGDITTVKVTDQLIGFATDYNGKVFSYRTIDQDSREAFLLFLNQANEKAVSGQDYGKGPGEVAKFERSA
jgi:hypothetical protein